MSGRNNKKFKLAVCLLAIFGVSIFGIQQAKAVNVNNQSGLENIDNYTRGEDINITRDINLTNANLPDITGAINAVVNGNNNTISGSIFNSDADRTLTFGHYTLQDNSSLTFNNVIFSTDTTIQGTQDRQSRAWTVAGLIAQNMASTSTVNINFSDFINNNVYLYQDRSGHNMDLQNYINGGLLNNASKMNITSSDFNNNTIRVATYKYETSLLQDGYAHAEMYGGIITNYETGVLTINGNGTASMSNNNISAYSESSTDRDPVHAIVQGGVINNEGTVLIDGVQINNNTVTASTNNYGDNATAQGGAIYNAQGAILTIQGNTSFTGNSVSASGANSNTAQGGAIYNAGAINVNGGKTTLNNNTNQGNLNDIYFAANSSLNVNNGEIEVKSGIESADNSAAINVNSGGNYINANNNSSNYKGSVNIKTNGILTYSADDINGGILSSLNNANITRESDSGLGFDILNDFTLDTNTLNSLKLTSDGTLNIYKFNTNNLTLENNANFGSYADEFIVEEGTLTGRKNNFNTDTKITVQKDGTFTYKATSDDEVFENNVILNNGATLNIEAKENTTISNSPDFTGENTVNLNNGSFIINTNFDDNNQDTVQSININNSSVSFGDNSNGIQEKTTLNSSTLNLADNKISTVEFAELVSNNSKLNIDINFNNNENDKVIINAGSGTINLDSINFIGSAVQTNYSFEVLNGSYTLGSYNNTIVSNVYNYLVSTNGSNVLLNATSISADGLKYYNHTLTGDRTFSFIGDETYNIASDLESTNGGNFIVNGKDNIALNSVISGGNKNSFFEINSDKLTVNNLTIQNAYATKDGASENINGSVLNAAGGSAEFNNVILNSNKADGMGGAIYVSGGNIELINSNLISNSSANGGAIALSGGSAIVNGGKISDNIAANEGSAIYNNGGEVNLADVRLENNSGNSSIYNTGTININNANQNTINNGQNAVIKNSGTISISGNGLTQIDDSILSAGDTKGNIIQNSSNLSLSNADNQNITQNTGTLTAVTISNSTINSNGNNLDIINADNSEITADNDFTRVENLNSSTVSASSTATIINNSVNGSVINAESGLLTLLNSDDSSVNVNNDAVANVESLNSSIYNQTSTGASTISNAINSNITIEGGSLNISTFEADDNSNAALNVDGGTVDIANAIQGNIDNNGSNININVIKGTLNTNADISSSDMNISGILNAKGDILDGSLNNNGVVNLQKENTVISASINGNGEINKTGGNLELTSTENNAFAGDINVNQGNLTFNQNAMLNSLADINLDNSTFNFALTNAEDISLTNQDFSSVNLKNASTMNVDGTSINQDISIQVGNGFWTSDNTGNTLNFSNASYYLLNETGGTQQNSDILSFTGANLSLETNQIWANTIKLSDSLLDLSNHNAGDTYTFNNLDASMNNNELSLDVSLVFDDQTGAVPHADKIVANSGSGILELTKLFISDDNGGAVNYNDPIQVIINNNTAALQLATSDDIEILSWATNVYEYGIETATTNTTADSIKITPEGVSSTDTLRDLNKYNGNRGFSFVTVDGSGHAVDNKYHIYRDLDSTAEGNFSVIGRVENGQKSILSGELKELHVANTDVRYDSANNKYYYYGPESDDGSRPIADSADVQPDMVQNENGEYVFEVGAMDNDNPVKTNGSLFELTNETNLYITDVQIQDALRTSTDNIKDGAAIYANNNNATVELDSVDFKNNIAEQGSGGAIANILSSSFIMKDSVIENNTSSQNGGAIYNVSNGETVIQNAQFNNNIAGNFGGAIYTESDLKIINSNFNNNNMQNNVLNDIFIAGGKTTFEVNDGITSTIASGIAGTNNAVFEKTDLGTLNLSGNNKDYLGKFNIADNGGVVSYSANTNDDSFVSGDVSIGQNATLSMNISANAVNQALNNVTGEGEINKTGNGALTLSGDNSAFSGNLNIENGDVNYVADNNSSYFGKESSTNISNGANLNVNIDNSLTNEHALYNLSGEGNVNKNGAGEVIISGNNKDFSGNIKVNEGSLLYENIKGYSSEDTSYISGLTELSNGTQFNAKVDGVDDVINGTFLGYGNFIKTGIGTLEFEGDLKDLQGDMTVDSGVFEFVKSADNGYIQGDTSVLGGAEFIYNTNGNNAELSQNITGGGNFTKDGSGTLVLNGDYSNLTGNATIQEGVLNYISSNGNGYFGGATIIDKNGELIFDTNGNNSAISNILAGINGSGTFNKTGDGTLTLSGNNASFSGNAIIDKGTLAFSDENGNTYFAGATTINENAVLAYTTGNNQTLSKVLGLGVIEKYGNGNLTFDYISNNQKFAGTLEVNEGTSTVNAAVNADDNFDFNMVVNNNSKLVYNAEEGQNYNIGQNSKVQFGDSANGANIEFNNGSYNLQNDLNNAADNTVTINNSTITLAADNYAGGYNLKDSQIDLANGSFSEHSFDNLSVDNVQLGIDINFEDPSNSDKLISNNQGSIVINELNILPETDAKDSGIDPVQFDVLGGLLTIDKDNSIKSNGYSTDLYEYTVSYGDDGQSVILTRSGVSGGNSLKKQNINTDVRNFEFTTTTTNPYVIEEDLTKTGSGTFTVKGTDTNDKPITIISGDDEHSMFEVGDNTQLIVKDINFTNANATDNDVSLVNPDYSKTSDNKNGSVLSVKGGSAQFDNVVMTNNKAEGLGGAIYLEGGNTVLNNIEMENNAHYQNGSVAVDNDIYVKDGASLSITGISSIKSGIAGDGSVVQSGDLSLSGNNKDFTGSLNVGGNLEFTQQNADDSYISGTSIIAKGANAVINNDYSDVNANFIGNGTLTLGGDKNLILKGDNSGFSGVANLEAGRIVLDSDSAKYFSGQTNLSDNTGIDIKGSNNSSLTKIVGNETTSINKDGSGTLTMYGDNSAYTGSLFVNNGTFALAMGSDLGKLSNATFEDGTKINLQNTSIVQNPDGTYTTNPSPSSLEDLQIGNLVLNGNTELYLDFDLASGKSDTINADNVSGSGFLILNKDSINVVSDALVDEVGIQIANGALSNYIKLDSSDIEVMGPIQLYAVDYDNGILNFSAMGGNNPSYNQVNPSVMAGAVAAQMGGYLVQLNSYDEAFRNMDMYMLLTKKQRDAMKYRNKYAYNGSSGIIYDASISRQENKSGWLRPFATFEQVDLDGGPDVSNVAYGSYFGIDSEFIDLGHGWDGVWSAYAGYNGSHQAYDGIGIYQNGGTLGVVGMAYKGNFFTGLTVNAGASAGRANVDAGYDDFTMLMSGVASKTGYNFELFDGKFIIQPSYMMSYSFVNTFDYTSASGVRVTSDPLHAIHIEPGIKFIGNLKNGWQPYMGISMIWNVMDKTKFMANEVYLPELSIKPFVKYGVGLRKSWGERFTGYLQTYITNGGRNGIGLQAGFNWALGKPVERQRQAFGIVPKVESVKFVKK